MEEYNIFCGIPRYIFGISEEMPCHGVSLAVFFGRDNFTRLVQDEDLNQICFYIESMMMQHNMNYHLDFASRRKLLHLCYLMKVAWP